MSGLNKELTLKTDELKCRCGSTKFILSADAVVETKTGDVVTLNQTDAHSPVCLRCLTQCKESQ